MQSEYDRDSLAKWRQEPQVEVGAVQGVGMNHIRLAWRQIEQMRRAWEIKVLNAPPPLVPAPEFAQIG
jgi:hypothetical protein